MTSDTEQRPTKRARSTSVSTPAKRSLEHDTTLWFNDGNIILACGDIGFRVHASVLSLNCGIFKDMLASGTPAVGELYEGVDLVRLSDDPADMRQFLKPMYFIDDGPMRVQYSVAQLKTLLDMGRKYMADHLRQSVIKHLRELFPAELRRAQGSYSTLRPTFGSFDPWVAVDISLEHDVPIILPLALYYSVEGMELVEILDLKISFAALREILLFREAFVAEIQSVSVDGEGYFDLYSRCRNNVADCSGIRSGIQDPAIRYYRSLEDDIFQDYYAKADPDGFCSTLCGGCLQTLVGMQEDLLEHLWCLLPSMCKHSTLDTWSAIRNAQAKADGVSVRES